EVRGTTSGERARALTIEGVGKEDGACIRAGGRDVVDVKVAGGAGIGRAVLGADHDGAHADRAQVEIGAAGVGRAVHHQCDGPAAHADRLRDVNGVPGTFAHRIAVQVSLGARAVDVVDADGVAVGEG